MHNVSLLHINNELIDQLNVRIFELMLGNVSFVLVVGEVSYDMEGISKKQMFELLISSTFFEFGTID
jgi:hypothetical protein